MTSPAVADVNVKQPDELSFVDEDIRELFEGCCYTMGMPLMAQLIKELRLWRQAGGGIRRAKPTQQEWEAAGHWLKERLGIEYR